MLTIRPVTANHLTNYTRSSIPALRNTMPAGWSATAFAQVAMPGQRLKRARHVAFIDREPLRRPVLRAAELIENLLPPPDPVRHSSKRCPSAKWCRERLRTRGFLGATGQMQGVCLVVLTAELGNPLTAETYHGSPARAARAAISLLLRPGGTLPGKQGPEPELPPESTAYGYQELLASSAI